METPFLNIKWVRIAELLQNIEKVNTMIEMHEQVTHNQSMIRQYHCQKDEFLTELQSIFIALKLTVAKAA
jgi:hypothetical protein